MTPAKPRPLLMPVTSTWVIALNRSTVKRLAFGDFGRPVLANLADKSLRLAADLLGMAALGLVGLLSLLVVEAELPGVVAVAILGADLQHRAGPAFQDRDRHDDAVLLIDLGHADFSPEQPDTHRPTPSKECSNPPAWTGVLAAGLEDAVVHLGCLGEVSSQIAARHHGNPGIGAIARRPVKAKPIEASDTTGLITHDR